MKGKNVIISWCWEDIQSQQPKWSERKCQEWLDNHAKIIRDRSVEEGWMIIEALLMAGD